jgi:xanthine/uracil/vitamin C permease (AzgA family)
MFFYKKIRVVVLRAIAQAPGMGINAPFSFEVVVDGYCEFWI